MLTELRIESLGAISVATAEFDRGFTVLTGETGTGKTMVVTGLHLLGGARADATRVRSGADRAVVEGRFTTTDLDDATVAGLQAVLDSSGAERDEDGSVIALRSISRDGPSRAYLGGRGVPAKSLSGFTNELLTLHGQNDQLRLMRPDEQRGALDRFAAAGEAVQRYRKLRDAWLTARRDLVDRRNRARELAQEADRLKFALNEIDTVDPQPGGGRGVGRRHRPAFRTGHPAGGRDYCTRDVVRDTRRGRIRPRRRRQPRAGTCGTAIER